MNNPAKPPVVRRRKRMGRLGFAPSKVSLKALLAAAPLDGIDLDRDLDLGRDVDL